MPLTYKQSGVDIDAGDALVERIKPLAKRTRIPEVLGDVGGFAGLCAVPSGLKEPVLVSGTDGVGTKLKVAFATGLHDGIGFDLVAMCVNDVITCGARPLFFLDYFATGKLDVAVAERVIGSIARACEESRCALLGGETAELPGMYADGEYDLAGFSVGVVEKAKIVDGTRVREDDVLLALPSSGLHSNGYSLARRALEASGGVFTDKPAALGGKALGDVYMQPTRIYARAVSAVLAAGVDVHAMSHITGGGLPGNLPRVLPEGLGARVAADLPGPPAVFDFVRAAGNVETSEMRRTFNMGIGFVFAVTESECARAVATLESAGEKPFVLGRVVRVPADRAFEERVEYPG
jgi:phosphoribosylformylglycinamidine cyclo-ligase